MANIIDGKAVSAKVKEQVRIETEELIAKHGIQPGLAVVIVGNDPASRVYVNNKKKACEAVGFKSFEYALPEETTQEELLELVDTLNKDKNVNGILEVLSYSKKPLYLEAAKSLCAGYDAWLKSLSSNDLAANRTYIAGTLKGFDVLIRNKVIGAGDYPLRATLEQLNKQLNKKK